MPTLDSPTDGVISGFTYFAVVLGGFAAVWTYRKLSGAKQTLPDFEYLAFSAIWGAVLVLIYFEYMSLVGKLSILSNTLTQYPFVVGPTIFIFGSSLGWTAFRVVKFIVPRWRNYQHKIPDWIRESFE